MFSALLPYFLLLCRLEEEFQQRSFPKSQLVKTHKQPTFWWNHSSFVERHKPQGLPRSLSFFLTIRRWNKCPVVSDSVYGYHVIWICMESCVIITFCTETEAVIAKAMLISLSREKHADSLPKLWFRAVLWF